MSSQRVLFALIVVGMVLVFAGAFLAWFGVLNRDPEGPFEVEELPAAAVAVDEPATAGRALRLRIDYEGATAEQVESEVVRPIEAALADLKPVSVSSESRPGNGMVTLVYAADGDPLEIAQNVSARLATVQLPTGATPPRLERSDDPRALPVGWLALKSDARSVGELRGLAEKVRDKLLTIPGMGAAEVHGSGPLRVDVTLDPDRLRALNLTASEVQLALERELSGGPNRVQPAEVRAEDLGQLVIRHVDGQPIRLADVAKVELKHDDDQRSLCRVQGRPAVLLALTPLAGTDAVDLLKNVREKLPALRADLPSDVKLGLPIDHTAAHFALVELSFPPGANREPMAQTADKADQRLRELGDGPDGKAMILGTVAVLEGDKASIYVQLADAVAPLDKIRAALLDLPGVQVCVFDLSAGKTSPRRTSDLDVVVLGPDLDQLATLADQLNQKLAECPAVAEVTSDLRPPVPETQVIAKREKLAKLGIKPRDFAIEAALVMGGVQVAHVKVGGRACLVHLKLPGSGQADPEQLKKVMILVPNGARVPFDSVAELRRVLVNTSIQHFGHERGIKLSINMTPGNLPAECRRILEKQRGLLPTGYSLRELNLGSTR